MTRDYQKWPGEGDIPVLCGNVEGADLKNNSQSTTHIIANFWLQKCTSLIQTFGKAGKHRHLLAVCLTKGQAYVWNYFWCFNKTRAPKYLQSAYPSQVRFQNMCHFHGWLQQFKFHTILNSHIECIVTIKDVFTWLHMCIRQNWTSEHISQDPKVIVQLIKQVNQGVQHCLYESGKIPARFYHSNNYA